MRSGDIGKLQPYIIKGRNAVVNVEEEAGHPRGPQRNGSESAHSLPANVLNEVKYTGGAKAERTLF
ncbi:hypothetical protein [Bradyrhizobium sp. CCBAU 11361]|uniref:hypothetical protein n=1 Tax=Bradyrhizobium sp. CCBAU 11361 TaxID=1630812 RepID=UPI002302C786|nr:hypothetical protein [Bradyrhizobium sp. CCBAU 11361]MDA9488066.1 hypothetical protein [Bradyrhizobium sp. CCBAU 11361]